MSKSSPDFVLGSNEDVIFERGEAVARGVMLFTAHWHVFVPSLIIAILYGLIWSGLIWTGKADFAFARFFIITMAVMVPLLIAWAFLRFQTIGLQLGDQVISFHGGWPQDEQDVIALQEVVEVKTHSGFLSRMFGGGDLVIKCGERSVTVRGLADPASAANAIQDALQTR